MRNREIKLSILDQSIISNNGSATVAIGETIQLVKLAESWGYYRFWVSEHHNLPNIAGSSPEILMARLANETQKIRIGSGGVMLPNHSALRIAENFRLLEAMYPGRIDIGVGRAPGGDRVTASMLNPSNNFSEESYISQLNHLRIFFNDEAGTEYGKLLAIPQVNTIPEPWMLGSSGGSSKIAAQFGMGLAIALFINGFASPAMVKNYKDHFIPSEHFPEPKIAISLIVLCADTEEKAMQLNKSINYQLIQRDKGKLEQIPEYEKIKNYSFNSMEIELLKAHQGKIVIGTRESIASRLHNIADRFEADEVIAVTWAAEFEDRKRSFELLAKAFKL